MERSAAFLSGDSQPISSKANLPKAISNPAPGINVPINSGATSNKARPDVLKLSLRRWGLAADQAIDAIITQQLIDDLAKGQVGVAYARLRVAGADQKEDILILLGGLDRKLVNE